MKNVAEAIKILKNGGIVVFPTDTAFGVGCRIDDGKAIRRLFELRRRPKSQATPVLVETLEMAQKYLLPLPQEVKNLMKKYWPGALTLILPCIRLKVPALVRGGGLTLGVRIPDYPVTRRLIREVGMPILGPSANFSGAKTPYKYEDLDPKFLAKVDFVIKEGESKWGKSSTVIDCSQKPWKIVREGAIKIEGILWRRYF